MPGCINGVMENSCSIFTSSEFNLGLLEVAVFKSVESDILEVEFFDFFRLFHAPTISLQSVLRGQIDCAERGDGKSLRREGDTEIRVPFALHRL
jgi:hypothetical protein